MRWIMIQMGEPWYSLYLYLLCTSLQRNTLQTTSFNFWYSILIAVLPFNQNYNKTTWHLPVEWYWHPIIIFVFLFLSPWRWQHACPKHVSGHYVIKLHSYIQAHLFAFSVNLMQPWTSLWNVQKFLFERKQMVPSPTTTGVAWQLENPWICDLLRAPIELSRSVRDSGLGDFEDNFYSNCWLQSAGWPDPVWSMQGKCSDQPVGENVDPGPTATRKWAQTKLTVSPTAHFPKDGAG